MALDLGGRAPAAISRGSVLVTPDAFEQVAVVDVRLTGGGSARLPERPVLHVGAAMATVRARPLGDGFARLTLERPLPLRIGDRAMLRDPGSRAIWGVRVLDPAPPALGRRGAARARGEALTAYDASPAGSSPPGAWPGAAGCAGSGWPTARPEGAVEAGTGWSPPPGPRSSGPG